MKHFVYQRVHTLAGKPLHLAAHLDLLFRAYRHIYGGETIEAPEKNGGMDEKTTTVRIAQLLKIHRIHAKNSATVMLYLTPDDNGAATLTMEYERTLLDNGYAHSSLRPKTVTYDYSIPFGGFPVSFQLSARALYDTLALRRHGATRSVRREGDKLLLCGDAPLFGIKGKRIFTTPLTEGVVDSVERKLVIQAAAQAHLQLTEEPLLHSEMRELDELFFADAAGITSLAECDGAKFMSLAAPRLAAAMNGLSLR